jgi:hypothetical protein
MIQILIIKWCLIIRLGSTMFDIFIFNLKYVYTTLVCLFEVEKKES